MGHGARRQAVRRITHGNLVACARQFRGFRLRACRDLIEATKPFMPESRLRGWWYLLSTTLVMAGLYALGWQPLAWPLRVAVAVLAGLVTVREFILYHDYVHGAFLRGSRLARAILYPVGVFPVRAYYSKPLPPSVLAESIRRLLKKQIARRSARSASARTPSLT